jgi:hypothetical protein
MRGFITSVMKGFITLEPAYPSAAARQRRKGDWIGLSPGHCLHHFDDEGTHHFGDERNSSLRLSSLTAGP